MWNKALWYREYQQLGIRIWMMVILHFGCYGFQRWHTWVWDEPETIEWRLSRIMNLMDAFDDGTWEGISRFLLALFAMLLSVIMVSGERRNGTQEMLFSLPYGRTQIFMVKWLFGAAVLTGSLLINTVIDMLAVVSSPLLEFYTVWYHIDQFVYTWITVMGIFALAMFIGTISGSIASHSVYLIIIWVLPWYLLEMITHFLYVHEVYPEWRYSNLEQLIQLPSHLMARYSSIEWYTYVIFSVLLVGCTIIGAYMYSRNRVENNGKLMVSKTWERVLRIGFVVCCAFLAGTIVGGMASNSLIMYYFGMLIGIALGTWIINSLTRLRLKI